MSEQSTIVKQKMLERFGRNCLLTIVLNKSYHNGQNAIKMLLELASVVVKQQSCLLIGNRFKNVDILMKLNLIIIIDLEIRNIQIFSAIFIRLPADEPSISIKHR